VNTKKGKRLLDGESKKKGIGLKKKSINRHRKEERKTRPRAQQWIRQSGFTTILFSFLDQRTSDGAPQKKKTISEKELLLSFPFTTTIDTASSPSI
jgi:hypothetical protein